MKNISCEFICPCCNKTLLQKKKERYCYDPIVYVDEILYYCPFCKYEKIVELLGQIEIQQIQKMIV
jgi:hypothetical protein